MSLWRGSTTGCVYIKSDGTPWRPSFIFAIIIAAAIAVLDAPEEAVYNETFNVGINEENFRVREIAEIVAEVVPAARGVRPDGGLTCGAIA